MSMKKSKSPSHPEKILCAAYSIKGARSGDAFTGETLSVVAWRQYPTSFGLRGYIDKHPDVNKVLSYVMGERGLVKRGYLRSLGQKTYQLTEAGRDHARRLLSGETTNGHAVTLQAEQKRLLLRLPNEPAVVKMNGGQKNDLTFQDAWRFWGLLDEVADIDHALTAFRKSLQTVEASLNGSQGDLGKDRRVSGGEVRNYLNVDDYCRERFERHLNLLRRRV